MRRNLYLIFLGAILVPVAGCVTVEKVVRERVDQEAGGNRGYIQNSNAQVTPPKGGSREYIDVKVEIPTVKEVKEELRKSALSKKSGTQDKSTGGNKGYLVKGQRSEETPPMPQEEPEQYVPEAANTPEYGEETLKEATDESAAATAVVSGTTYTVKEGDSLSKISKQLYGKASKWTVIYEANAGKIKDPNRLKPGTVLTIPALEETKAGSENVK